MKNLLLNPLAPALDIFYKEERNKTVRQFLLIWHTLTPKRQAKLLKSIRKYKIPIGKMLREYSEEHHLLPAGEVKMMLDKNGKPL